MEGRFSSSVALVQQPLEFGEPGFDRVFISAKAKPLAGGWQLDIDQDCPVVALNEKVREEFQLNCPTVNEIRSGQYPELTLVSAGSFIWIEEMGIRRLYLLRRDLTAPSDPGLMTGPAGRCDKLISATMAEETNEEMLIVFRHKKSGLCKIQVFLTDQENLLDNEGMSIKMCQLDDFFECLKQVNPKGFWNLENHKISKVMAQTGPLHRVFTFVQGEYVEAVDVNIAFMDQANHTLELRNILELQVPEGCELALIRDGEKLNREVVSFTSLAEVPIDKTVPTLRHYIIRSDATSPVELLQR